MAELETLDNIASEATPSEITSDTPTTETAPKVETVEKVENASKATEQKISSRKAQDNQIKEMRSFYDRKVNELTSKITDYEKKFSSYAPLDQYLPELQKALDEKKKQELQQQFQQNPLQFQQDQLKNQQQLLEKMLNDRLAPIQHQAMQATAQAQSMQTIAGLKQEFGETSYTETEPLMVDIINSTKEQFGPDVSRLLAENPRFLFMTAYGINAYQKSLAQNQTQIDATANKKTLAARSAGISKPNQTARISNSSSPADIEKAVENYLNGI